MAQIRKTPGVYVEEVSNLAPSVASVATAVPAFVGHTEKGPQNVPTVVTSYLEYKEAFGGAPNVEYTSENGLTNAKFVMDTAMRLYFDNGGGKCYIVSVGDYTNTASVGNLKTAVGTLAAVDEVTLIACPDAAMHLSATDLQSLHKEMLTQCGKLMDRVAILDIVNDGKVTDDVKNFRTGVGGCTEKSYGAAYYPNLKAAYAPDFSNASVANYITAKKMDSDSVCTALTGDNEVAKKRAKATATYKNALAALQDMACEVTPSAAVIGAIVSTDARFGVWKAPANIGLASVKDVVTALNNDDQETLNEDASTGISVNCVRKFFGKGILVWGARTLDGISNEWRYISVRRLFNYIEESIQKSTMWAVFEPNDVNTWMKIKCQISNFLTGLWRQGALVGATPDDAYFVNVGVPATMTQDDINNGRLIVQVGIAASRPAEFITLEFSHKMEQ